jgi:tryptophan 7-halogenase
VTGSVQRLVVVGGGAEAWTTAIALGRAFRHRKLEVTVLDTGPTPDAPIGYWTVPSQRGVNAMIGVRESDLLRIGASFKLATEHRGWGGGDSRFLHAHAEIGTDIEGMPFYKYLQLAAITGRADKPEHYSVAAIASGLARFARPKEGSPLTSNFTYAYHIEAAPYVALLREVATAQGVRRIENSLADVNRSADGDVESLQLADGARVASELFLDCSGRKAQLMNFLDAGEREDWSTWLPCDRQWSALAGPQENPPPLTRTIASDAGWLWWAPLAQASMVGHVYSSTHLGDDEALAQLRKTVPDLRTEPRLTRFSSGRRRHPWIRNCIALGDAAVELEPLAGTQLHIAQLGIGTLVELFPLDARSRIEAVEYNRIMGEHADALRDFTMAHYRANASRTGAFWEATRSEPGPSRLTDKLDLYRASGRIILLDYETFEEVDWAWLLLGSGCLPVTLEAQIQRLVEKVTPADVMPLHRRLVDLAKTMPPHAQSLRPHG